MSKDLFKTIKEVYEQKEEDIEEKVLYKSPTGWNFELFGGKVIIIGKNSGTYEVPTKDFKALQKIIGNVKI